MDWLKIVVASLMRQIEKLNKKKADRSDVERLKYELPEGIPEGYTAHQQLVTDEKGNTQWEDRVGGYIGRAECLVPRTNFSFTNGTYNIIEDEAFDKYTLNDHVLVIYDGVEYRFEWKEQQVDSTAFIMYCGNLYWYNDRWSVGRGDDTGEPFVIHDCEYQEWVINGDPDDALTHSIEVWAIDAIRIPQEYLDLDGIATEESVSEQYMTIENPIFTKSLSMGRKSGTTIGEGSIALGYRCTSSGRRSYAQGSDVVSSSFDSHAEGNGTTASGSGSHAEGLRSVASGNFSHAEGCESKAEEEFSHAEGSSSKAKGKVSHAEGGGTTAEGSHSHSEGRYSKAIGSTSHAEGESTTANGDYSHAEGLATIASGASQHAQGKYNIEDTENKYAHVVGNGDSNTARTNAHTVDWNGLGWFAGGLKVGGTGQDDEAAREVILAPESAQAHKQLVTDADGNTAWEDKLAYIIPSTNSILVENATVNVSTALQDASGGDDAVVMEFENEPFKDWPLAADSAGVKFTVYWDQVVYNDLEQTPQNSMGWKGLGGVDYPFVIYCNSASELEIYANDIGEHIFSVYMQGEPEIVKPIDPKLIPNMIVTIRNPGADNASCDKTSIEIAEAANKGIPVIGHIIELDDSGVEQMRIANFAGLWDNGTPETIGAFFYDMRLANGFKTWGDNLSLKVLEVTPDATVSYCGGSAFAAQTT